MKLGSGLGQIRTFKNHNYELCSLQEHTHAML